MTAVVGIAKGGITNPGSFSVTPPAGAGGYLAILCVGASDLPTITPPSGFTIVASGHSDSFSSWYIYTGVPGAGSSWACPASGWSASLIVIGYDTTVTVNARDVTSSTNTCPAVSATAASVVVRAQTGNPYPDLATIGYPSGTTNQDARQDPTGNDPDDHSMVAVAHSTLGAAGTTGTAAWTTTGNDSYSSHTLSITNVTSNNRTGVAASVGPAPAQAAVANGARVHHYVDAFPGTAPVTGEGGVTLSTVFESSVPGHVTKVRFPYHSTMAGQSVLAFALTDAEVMNPAVPSASDLITNVVPANRRADFVVATQAAGTYVEVVLPEPVPVAAGQNFAAGVYMPNGTYYAESNRFIVNSVSGVLTGLRDTTATMNDGWASNGRYFYAGTPSWPITAFNRAYYYMDVEFQTVSVTGAGASVGPAPAQAAAGTVASSTRTGVAASVGPLPTQAAAGTVVNPASDYRFPRTIDSSGRFFRDQDGDPVLIKGDSPWSAFTDLSTAQWETWCANREEHGFNACYISAVGDSENGGRANGETYDGIFPFVGGNIITAPNETYWARVDQFFNIAESHGITIFLYLIDSWNVMTGSEHVFYNKSAADCYTYGQFIGNRYGDRENVVWMVGGDYVPVTNEPWLGAPTDLQFDAALRGARDVEDIWHARSIQLFWQPDGAWSTQNPYWRRRVDFQHVYIYQPQYVAVTPAYVNGPVTTIAPSNPVERVAPDDTRAPNGTDPIRPNIPSLFMEGAYEFGTHNGPSDTPADMRRQVGWSLTSGSPGDFYGSNDWQFLSGWETRLDTAGVIGSAILRAAVEATAWWKVIPSQTFVVTGKGTAFVRGANPNTQVPPTSNDWATAAVAVDGTLALVYVPTQRSITINTALLGANRTGTWVNASTGAETAAVMGALLPPSSGDWLLVVEADPAPTVGTGVTVGPNPAQAAAGTVALPIRTGVAASVGPAPSQVGTGTTVVPQFTGTIGSVGPSPQQSATATFAIVPRTGTASSVGPLPVQQALGAGVLPQYVLTGNSVGPAPSQGAAGTVVNPAGFVGLAASVGPFPSQSAQATYVPPTTTGAISSTGPAPVQSITGVLIQPARTGVIGSVGPLPEQYATNVADACWPQMSVVPRGPSITLVPRGPAIALEEAGCRP